MRNPRFSPTFTALAMAFIVLCASADAQAQLGGAMPLAANSTGAAPKTLLNGALRLRTSTDAGNTTINEYATNTGQIIAYAWEGPTMPNLRALLGKYADSYLNGAAALPPDGNLHASRVVRADVVVESNGPMRGYVGRAWLPAALPPGVTADDIR